MAALTATTPTRTGVASPGAAVAASDTIPLSAMGQRGAYLEILNGNVGADSMTVSDAGLTPAGSPLSGGNFAVSVPAGANRVLLVKPEQADPATGNVTVTHSVTATVTYKLYPI